MNYYLLGLLLFFLFILGMLFFFYLGKLLLLWHTKKFPTEEHHKGNKIIEGAIFALMGLLIAFTFSGASERFNIRRTLVLEEANAIEAAYLRLDLLPDAVRTNLQSYFRQYLNTRFTIYKLLPDMDKALPEIKQSQDLQRQIWSISVQSCKQESISSACIVLLPALTKMIDLANMRDETTAIHPPIIILITLVGLALLSAVLSGYSMRKKSIWHSTHILIYVITIAFTIFIIIDLEYPRLDFIQVDYFSYLFAKIASAMKI